MGLGAVSCRSYQSGCFNCCEFNKFCLLEEKGEKIGGSFFSSHVYCPPLGREERTQPYSKLVLFKIPV